MKNNTCKILSNIRICDNIFEMRFIDKDIAELSRPGQFIHISVGNEYGPILRRPISISDVNKDDSIISLVYQTVGKGTTLLSKMSEGDTIDIIGPLGNGFPIYKEKKCAIVGGGIGIAPLLFLTKELTSCDIFLGFKTDTYLIKDFEKTGFSVNIATENGISGYSGYVTDLLKNNIEKYDIVYSCGPKLMMQKVSQICNENNKECFISLEERMACGIGACLVCTCKIKVKDDKKGYSNKRVCKDGPVFNAKEVIFDD